MDGRAVVRARASEGGWRASPGAKRDFDAPGRAGSQGRDLHRAEGARLGKGYLSGKRGVARHKNPTLKDIRDEGEY